MPGVKKVVSVDDNAVVVVADTYWNAKTALEKLPVAVGCRQDWATSSRTRSPPC